MHCVQGLAIQGDRELPFTRSGTLDYMAPEARPRAPPRRPRPGLLPALCPSARRAQRPCNRLALLCFAATSPRMRKHQCNDSSYTSVGGTRKVPALDHAKHMRTLVWMALLCCDAAASAPDARQQP